MIEQQILIEEVNTNEINDVLQLIVDRENIFPSNTGDTIINSSKRDKELMNILLSCERYVLKQRELDQELSSGFYRLAQSRRNRGSHIVLGRVRAAFVSTACDGERAGAGAHARGPAPGAQVSVELQVASIFGVDER